MEKIRLMTIKDLDVIMDIEYEAFSMPWSYQSYVNDLKGNMGSYIVYEIDDIVVGYAGMWFIVDEGHITTIAVHKDYRGRGISKKLLENLIETAKNNKFVEMILEVRVSNVKAINLYKSFGFKDIFIREKYYENNDEDAIVMHKIL